MRRRKIPQLVAVLGITLAIACGSALGYFSSTGGGSAAAAVTSLNASTLTATANSGGTVSLSWTQVMAPGSGAVTYYITRNGGAPAEACPDSTGPETVYSCTDSGLAPGTYEYKVIALWSSWSKASVVKTATVTVGPVAKFTVTAATTSPSTGAYDNLTVTATDSAGKTVTTFTGSHNIVFGGASSSAEGKAPTVTNASGTAINFGTATALTFNNGTTTVSSNQNGALQIYKPGEAKITATEGSLTTPAPLVLNVLPTATQFVLSASSTTPNVGSPVNLTIKAYDGYGNASTNYTGSHNLVFSGGSTSPSGKAPTVENSSGTATAFGTATAINFSAGVATVAEGKNGEMILYTSGSQAIKATEGSVTTPTALTVTPVAGAAASLTLSGTTSNATTTLVSLTETAKDTYGNTATSYTGEKKITFAASGTASESSPNGTAPYVVNNAGTQVPFGTAAAINFTNGVATVASSKNGALRLTKVGSANLTISDGTFTSAAVAFTATVGAGKVAFTSLTVSAGTIGSPCYFTCTVTGLGNSGTITSKITIADEFANVLQNVGSGKSVTIAVSGWTITGSPVALPETGAATSTATFSVKSPSSGSFTNTVITATSTGYTEGKITASK